MSWRRYWQRRHRDDEAAREIEAHLEIEFDDNLARGMSAQEARRAARLRFGSPTIVREAIHEMNTPRLADAFWRDLTYAVRQLKLHPVFTVTAVLSLALRIGANTAIFTLIDQILLRPLRVALDAGRGLILLRDDDGDCDWHRGGMRPIYRIATLWHEAARPTRVSSGDGSVGRGFAHRGVIARLARVASGPDDGAAAGVTLSCMKSPLPLVIAGLAFALVSLDAHEGHGKKNAPAAAKLLKNPLTAEQAKPGPGQAAYEQQCAGCHGADGLSKTPAAAGMKVKPTNIVDHRMASMKDGEIYWVIANGIGKTMPGFKGKLSEIERWQVVGHVRELGRHQTHH